MTASPSGVSQWYVDEIDRFLHRSVLNPAVAAGPRESFHEANNAWILRLDLPAFSKQDITLTVTDRTLRLAAGTPPERPLGGKLERQWKPGGAPCQPLDSNCLERDEERELFGGGVLGFAERAGALRAAVAVEFLAGGHAEATFANSG